jgi:hypothetical protein
MIGGTILHYKILDKLGERGLARRNHLFKLEMSNDRWPILHYKMLEKLGEPACRIARLACRRQGRACPPQPS